MARMAASISRNTASELGLLSSREKSAGVTPRYAGAECELGEHIAAFARDGRGAYLSGPVGAGKTHALMAAARLLVRSGVKCRVTTFSALLDREQASFPSNGGDGYSWVAEACRKPVLLLDELGEGKPTEWAVSQLYRIVDSRYQDGLPLLCASNLTLPQLGRRLSVGGETTGARIVSRLYEMCVQLSVDGGDRRISKARENARETG